MLLCPTSQRREKTIAGSKRMIVVFVSPESSIRQEAANWPVWGSQTITKGLKSTSLIYLHS